MSAGMESDHEQKKKSKKSKRKQQTESEAAPADQMDIDVDASEAPESTKKEKKKKSKDKKRKERIEDAEEGPATPAEPAVASPEKKRKRHKSDDMKDKKDKSSSQPASSSLQPPSSSAAAATRTIPDSTQYPFFTQTFSQRIPIWPAAFDEPLTKTAREYLDPLLNRYSPKFKGVLLAYKNVNLADRPRRANLDNLPTDETPVTLVSFECYAPPFAWLTADLHLFVPTRGAWMEGEINLQSEGHIGVVCFGKFNASIARRSLPKGWHFVEQEEVDEDPFEEPVAAEGEEDGAQENGENKESAPRLRSTGYWVDESGSKVEGKIYFRIKNFSSGSTGDFTYLSLQGTMLDDAAEKASAAEEREVEKARRARMSSGGLPSYPSMRVPESSMTKLKEITR